MATTLTDVPLGKIKLHPNNPRHDVGTEKDLAELAASIAELGVIEPLTVVADESVKSERYLLIAGHRRHAAAKQAGVKTVPCLVRDDLDGMPEQLEVMLVENLQRTDLTPVEEAEAYQQLLTFPDYTIKKITAKTGRSAGTVRNRMALTKLSDKVREQLQSGQVSLADATVLTEFASDPDRLATLEGELGKPNWAWTVQRLRAERDGEKKLAKAEKRWRDAGVRILTKDEYDDYSSAWDSADGPPYPVAFISEVDQADVGDLVADPFEHSTCAGAAVWVHGVGLDVVTEVHLCTEPSRHQLFTDADEHARVYGDEDTAPGEPGDAGTSSTTRAERTRPAVDPAVQKLTDDLAAAGAVRRQHLAAFVRRATEKDTAIARSVLVDQIHDEIKGLGTYSRPAVVQLVAAVLGTPVGATPEQYGMALDSLSLVQLVIVSDILDHRGSEAELTDQGERGWGVGLAHYNADHTQQWRQLLGVRYGYVWSDVERDLDAKAADQAEQRANNQNSRP